MKDLEPGAKPGTRVDIYATVFHPVRDGGTYLILASAYASCSGESGPPYTGRSAIAFSLAEARERCKELSDRLVAALVSAGYEMGAIHVADWG